MQIKIKETNEIAVITLIDPNSGFSWENDFIFNSISRDDYLKSDTDDADIIMTQENYDWWYNHCQQYEIADNMLHEKRKNIKEKNEYGECTDFDEKLYHYINGYDFNSQPEAIISFCKEY